MERRARSQRFVQEETSSAGPQRAFDWPAAVSGGYRARWAVLGILGVVALSGCRSVDVASDPTPTGPAAPSGAVGAWRSLTPAEERIIVGKGTEPAFSGALYDNHRAGTYRCKRCGAPLFSSDAKFDSGTGWPSFDQALPGAVREVPDADGARVEIVCARCGAHLGHVFRGEHMTDRDTRHCVNSVSLRFQEDGAARPKPTGGDPDGVERSRRAEAYFAGGCFWGVEALFEDRPGVLEAVSGYMGGQAPHPTYQRVSTGTTGYVETVKVVYDPALTSYEALARWFFMIHDPTQVGRQGPDVGDQYRSIAFVADAGQREVVTRLIQILRSRGLQVATVVAPAGRFWPAEAYHQDHYRRVGGQPYCHAPVDRFGPE